MENWYQEYGQMVSGSVPDQIILSAATASISRPIDNLIKKLEAIQQGCDSRRTAYFNAKELLDNSEEASSFMVEAAKQNKELLMTIPKLVEEFTGILPDFLVTQVLSEVAKIMKLLEALDPSVGPAHSEIINLYTYKDDETYNKVGLARLISFLKTPEVRQMITSDRI